MSIRVHDLAKHCGLTNKEMVEKLRAMNYPVKSHSSTVDKITAESIEKEYGYVAPPPPPAPAAPASPAPAPTTAATEKIDGAAVVSPPTVLPVTESPKPVEPPKPPIAKVSP